MVDNFNQRIKKMVSNRNWEELLTQFCLWLDKAHYTFQLSDGSVSVPSYLRNRYIEIPNEALQIIVSFDEIENSTETVFFLTHSSFEEVLDSAFTYDTFEKLSIESAAAEEQRVEILEFWNTHIPFLISLHNGYEYYAVSIKDGSIVHGCEPEFEAVSVAADSMLAFIGKLIVGDILL